MEIIISGRHFDVTEELRAHAQKHLQRLASEFPKLTSVRLVMAMERSWHIAEVHVYAKRAEFDAKARTQDMYVSVDSVAEKLEKQLRRHLDRVQHHRARKEQEEPQEEGEEIPDEDLDQDEEME